MSTALQKYWGGVDKELNKLVKKRGKRCDDDDDEDDDDDDDDDYIKRDWYMNRKNRSKVKYPQGPVRKYQSMEDDFYFNRAALDKYSHKKKDYNCQHYDCLNTFPSSVDRCGC